MDAEGRAMQEQLAEKLIQCRNRAKRRLLEVPNRLGLISCQAEDHLEDISINTLFV